MTYVKTTRAASILGVSYWQLFNLIRFDKIRRPPRDDSGHYVWGPDNMVEAREKLGLPEPKKTEESA